MAASPTTVTGTAPAIRARRSRGARPRSTATVSAGVVVSAPVVGSAVTTALTRPSSPSKRTAARDRARIRRPSRSTTRPRSTPAACSLSAARAVTIPASRLPGQTGWISAAPVATTISCGWTWSIPRRRPDDDHRSRRRSRRPRRPSCASRTRTRLAGRSASAAAASPLDPPPMTATSTSRWCSATVDRAAASLSGPRRPPRGVAASPRPDAARPATRAAPAVWHVRT